MVNWEMDERAFLLLCLVNLIAALLYLLAGALIISPMRTRKERKEGIEVRHDNRRTYLLRFLVMILCPVAGPLFFLFSYLLFRIPLWAQPDLEDVVFSKDRVKTRLKADEERERNMVPLEEAMFVNESRDLRLIMMNTLRGDVHAALGVITLALDSDDSETAHYAASVLSSELDTFRTSVNRLFRRIREETAEETAAELELIPYMDDFLRQGVFSQIEQKKLTKMMEEAAESLYKKDASLLTAAHYESVCLQLMEISDYTSAEKWCQRLNEQYPDTLVSFTCRLKLCFSTKNWDNFFQTLSALRKSDVVIDSETLELIRIFS